MNTLNTPSCLVVYWTLHDIAWYLVFSFYRNLTHLCITHAFAQVELESPQTVSMVHLNWCCFPLLSYFLMFIEPRVFIGLHSIGSEGKSISLIHLGLPSYPSFLSSRIALFFNLQLTLLQSTCLNVLPSHSPPSLLPPLTSLPFSCLSAVPRPPLVTGRDKHRLRSWMHILCAFL